MGVDYIGWRDCSLQAALEQEGFLRKLKLRAYRRVVEEKVPPERRDVIQLRVDVVGRGVQTLTYPGILEQLGDFEAGAPECADCLLGSGAPLGCYRYISYPVDSVAESAIFEFVCSQVATKDSIADQLYRDLFSRVPDDSDWYGNRGEDGQLAELEEPLVFEFMHDGELVSVDSAQVLAATFYPLDHAVLVVAFARYFGELIAWLDKQQAERPAMQARALEGSRTLKELRALYPMVLVTGPMALTAGWSILVDG